MKSLFISILLSCCWLLAAQVTEYNVPVSVKGASAKQLLASSTDVYISTAVAKEKIRQEKSNRLFYAFPELREKPIQWFDSLRTEWLVRKYDPQNAFKLEAQPGEYMVYQVGIWAVEQPANDVRIKFSDLKGGNGKTISLAKMTCFNMGGTDIEGKSFVKNVDVAAGRVQALWMGLDLEGATAGTYKGSVTVSAGGQSQQIPVQLEISGQTVANHGFDQGVRMSRLAWLNSTTALDDKITKDFIPIQRSGNDLKILGRTVTIADNGLPAQISTWFTPSNQSVGDQPEPLMTGAMQFVIEKENGEIIRLKSNKLQFVSQTPSTISWKVTSTSSEFELLCVAQMEFDGFANYSLQLKAKKPARVKDIRMEVPMQQRKSVFMMGLGFEGGERPAEWKWQWDVKKNQDALWVGAVNGGLRIKWKAENYTRPLVNIYYEFGRLNLPPSWGNENKGGVTVTEKPGTTLINAYSGARELKTGEVLNYDFELLVTPFKAIDNKIKYHDRYYHGGGSVTAGKIEKARKTGANIINIHHNEDIYPFINYPYIDENVPALTNLVHDAHQHKMRMKFYYTTRELTINLPEFWALYSLNGEVIFPGPGNDTRTEALHPKGPNEWLLKNLRERYIPAWYNKIESGRFKGSIDLSVITTPDSRWNNFYIGGLDWMVSHMNLDGVYIDDSALDRITLRRARKVIDRARPEGRIDLHSWNHFNGWAGFANCLNLYMDLLPYLDLVWIGESRDYNRMPDHWLIEVSGIPFGLPGQMLEGGGNPWRGMVYGITNRAGWAGKEPTSIWEFWDKYHINQKEMIGYWDENTPVQCNNKLVKATIYKGDKESIIAVANWGNEDHICSLSIDWNKMGYKPTSTFIVPAIEKFQEEQTLKSLDMMTIPAGKGFLVIVKNEK